VKYHALQSAWSNTPMSMCPKPKDMNTLWSYPKRCVKTMLPPDPPARMPPSRRRPVRRGKRHVRNAGEAERSRIRTRIRSYGPSRTIQNCPDLFSALNIHLLSTSTLPVAASARSQSCALHGSASRVTCGPVTFVPALSRGIEPELFGPLQVGASDPIFYCVRRTVIDATRSGEGPVGRRYTLAGVGRSVEQQSIVGFSVYGRTYVLARWSNALDGCGARARVAGTGRKVRCACVIGRVHRHLTTTLARPRFCTRAKGVGGHQCAAQPHGA